MAYKIFTHDIPLKLMFNMDETLFGRCRWGWQTPITPRTLNKRESLTQRISVALLFVSQKPL